MLVTEFPIVTLVKPLQPLKTYSPILSTEFPIFTRSKPLQASNALFGMVLTLSPNITDDKDIHFLNTEEISLQFSALYSTLVKPVQRVKASPPILTTEFPIFTHSKPSQS